MVIGWVPKLALATAAVVGLYVPTLGLPLPGSCMRTGGVASAAPSPTCASDLRDCLRLSAKEGLYGVRYVTADDVARCIDAFNACIHGGASAGGSTVPPTSTGGERSLPKRLRITYETTAIDCRVNGDSVTCTSTRQEPLPAGGTYSETGEIRGSVSGLTFSGTVIRHGKSAGDSSGCISDQVQTGPVRYDFSLDGSVVMRDGPIKQDIVFSGTCAKESPTSTTHPVWQGIAKWSPIGE